MVRLLTRSVLCGLAVVPLAMIAMHESFTSSLGMGITIGFLVLISPFLSGGR